MITLKKKFLAEGIDPIGTSSHVMTRLRSMPRSRTTETAERLIRVAYDHIKNEVGTMGLSGAFKRAGVTQRNPENPPHLDVWAGMDLPFLDAEDASLPKGQNWNDSNTMRATLTGETIELAGAMPQHPYLDHAGLEGRILGRFGPNPTIDICPVTFFRHDGKLQAASLNITKWDDHSALVGGHIESEPDENGRQQINENILLINRVKELFEEAISGSITLPPETASALQKQFGHDRLRFLQEEAIAKYKLVQQTDPEFLKALTRAVSTASTAFAGPGVISANTTQNSWGETNAAWFTFSPALWRGIRGNKPAFDYALSPGDDAGSVLFNPFGAMDLQTTNHSHRALKAYIFADLIMRAESRGLKVEETGLLDQAEDMIRFFKGEEIRKPPYDQQACSLELYR